MKAAVASFGSQGAATQAHFKFRHFIQDGCFKIDAVTWKCYLSQQQAMSRCTDGPIRQEAPASKPTKSEC